MKTGWADWLPSECVRRVGDTPGILGVFTNFDRQELENDDRQPRP